MTDLKQLYKCNVCGNIIEVVHRGNGQLVCCGEAMQLQEEKKNDQGLENHVPIMEKTEKGVLIKVGSIEHPMENAHFIEWIEVGNDQTSCKKFLEPGKPPEATFTLKNVQWARIYCNLHGLWSSK